MSVVQAKRDINYHQVEPIKRERKKALTFSNTDILVEGNGVGLKTPFSIFV